MAPFYNVTGVSAQENEDFMEIMIVEVEGLTERVFQVKELKVTFQIAAFFVQGVLRFGVWHREDSL